MKNETFNKLLKRSQDGLSLEGSLKAELRPAKEQGVTPERREKQLTILDSERKEDQNKLKLKLYHGTQEQINSKDLKPNSDSIVLDQALGVHYAADRIVAEWFGRGETGKIIENEIELDPDEILDVPHDNNAYDADNIKQFVMNILGIAYDAPPQETAIRFREWAKTHGIKALRYQNTQFEETYGADDNTCYILLD